MTRPPLKAELSMQSLCFPFVTEEHTFALCIYGRGLNPPPLHSSRLLAPHWYWSEESAEQRNTKSFSFPWSSGTVIQLLFSWWTGFMHERGVISSTAVYVALSACILCYRAWRESITRVNSCLVLPVTPSAACLERVRLESHIPSIPGTLFTRSVLQRCREKPQAILENRQENSHRIHQWAEWDSRAWFALFWKSNKLTPWIMRCCEIGYTCPRVFYLQKSL